LADGRFGTGAGGYLRFSIFEVYSLRLNALGLDFLLLVNRARTTYAFFAQSNLVNPGILQILIQTVNWSFRLQVIRLVSLSAEAKADGIFKNV
jgi:hypothetical protein